MHDQAAKIRAILAADGVEVEAGPQTLQDQAECRGARWALLDAADAVTHADVRQAGGFAAWLRARATVVEPSLRPVPPIGAERLPPRL